MNAASNDFVIFDARNNEISLTTSQIQKICTRTNIGCDQLIIIKNDSSANCFMEIYNTDGSSSNACGNATRCVAALLFEETTSKEVRIRTNAGILLCSKEGNQISVNMGKPEFESSKIPITKEINTQGFDLLGHKFYAMNIGNPHIVTYLNQELSEEDFLELGAKLESHELFPQKTNVEFAKIITPNLIEARVFERGVGETLACGSGACAIGTLAIKNKLIPTNSTTIRFKGGDIKITLNEDESVTMSGDYHKIFSGTIDETFLN